MKTIIALTHDDPSLWLEFMMQQVGENQPYRVICLGGGVASVFCGDMEVFTGNTSDVHRTMKTYLRRRFQDFEILNVSQGVG